MAGWAVITTGSFTVTTADPIMSAAMEAQVPSVKVEIVYVVVAVGVTFTFIIGDVPLKAVPSDNVPEMVPLPVTAKDNAAVLPLQIACVPLRIAVGRGFTITVEVPVISADITGQVPLVKVEIV